MSDVKGRLTGVVFHAAVATPEWREKYGFPANNTWTVTIEIPLADLPKEVVVAGNGAICDAAMTDSLQRWMQAALAAHGPNAAPPTSWAAVKAEEIARVNADFAAVKEEIAAAETHAGYVYIDPRREGKRHPEWPVVMAAMQSARDAYLSARRRALEEEQERARVAALEAAALRRAKEEEARRAERAAREAAEAARDAADRVAAQRKAHLARVEARALEKEQKLRHEVFGNVLSVEQQRRFARKMLPKSEREVAEVMRLRSLVETAIGYSLPIPQTLSGPACRHHDARLRRFKSTTASAEAFALLRTLEKACENLRFPAACRVAIDRLVCDAADCNARGVKQEVVIVRAFGGRTPAVEAAFGLRGTP